MDPGPLLDMRCAGVNGLLVRALPILLGLGRSVSMSHESKKESLQESPGARAGVASKPSQSLGRWIDNLLGDKKARKRAAMKAAERRKFFPEISH